MKNFKIYLMFLILLPISLFSQEVNFKQIDSLHSQFEHENALNLLLENSKIDSTNFQTLWRISRAYVDIAQKMPNETGDEEDEQLAVYEKALTFAEKAVQSDTTMAVCYLRRAIANGKIALFKGVFSVAGVVNSVRDDCENAIKLGNGDDYTQAVAHYVLARTHAKISAKWAPARAVLGLGWADNEIAIEEYKKAIELYPDMIMFHLDYAKSLIEEDGEELAINELKKLPTYTLRDEKDQERLNEAKELLIEIE